MNEHFVAHQQALVKDNIVRAVFAFEEHDTEVMESIFANHIDDYDTIVDLCVVKKDAYVDGAWTGTEFVMRPYANWTYNTATKVFDPPQEYPTDGKYYYWVEDKNSWVECVGCDPEAEQARRGS
jgi:hypothetical protein